MNRYKVWGLYSAYAVIFAVSFIVMLAVLSAAVLCFPAGVLFAVLGGAMMLFEVSFVVTGLSPVLMLFGGLFAACASVFLILLSVRAGFALAKLFQVFRRRCERLRGW